MYRCSVCGKSFQSGALIVRDMVFCPDCAREYEDLIDSCVVELLEQYMNTGTIDVKSVVSKHKDKIDKLKISEAHVMRIVASQVVGVARGRQQTQT